MKRTIAGLVAGLVLGTAATAGAVTVGSSYWNEDGADYSCQGVGAGMDCKAGMYEIGITRSFLYLQPRSHPGKKVFFCRKWGSWSQCIKSGGF